MADGGKRRLKESVQRKQQKSPRRALRASLRLWGPRCLCSCAVTQSVGKGSFSRGSKFSSLLPFKTGILYGMLPFTSISARDLRVLM